MPFGHVGAIETENALPASTDSGGACLNARPMESELLLTLNYTRATRFPPMTVSIGKSLC